MGFWNKLFGTLKTNTNEFSEPSVTPDERMWNNFVQTIGQNTAIPNDPTISAEEAAFNLSTQDFTGQNEVNNQSSWLSSSDYSGFKNSDNDY